MKLRSMCVSAAGEEIAPHHQLQHKNYEQHYYDGLNHFSPSLLAYGFSPFLKITNRKSLQIGVFPDGRITRNRVTSTLAWRDENHYIRVQLRA